jgi:PAS domain-containing protein
MRAFLAASLKGWQYAMRHQDELTDLIISKYHSEKDREALRYEANQMDALMFPDLIEIGHMNPGRWRHIGDTYVRLGMLRSNYSLDGFLYDPNPVRDLRWVWWTVAISVGSSLLLTGAVAGLVRINRRITNAERLAREAHGMLQAVLDAIPVGVFWNDRQGKLLGCNSVFAGYSTRPICLRDGGAIRRRIRKSWRKESPFCVCRRRFPGRTAKIDISKRAKRR